MLPANLGKLLKSSVKFRALDEDLANHWESQTYRLLLTGCIEHFGSQSFEIQTLLQNLQTLLNAVKVLAKFAVQTECCIYCIELLAYYQAVIYWVVGVLHHLLNNLDNSLRMVLAT